MNYVDMQKKIYQPITDTPDWVINTWSNAKKINKSKETLAKLWDLKTLTIDKVSELLGWNLDIVVWDHSILIEIAKVNEDLLNALGFEAKKNRKKFTWISKINVN